MFFVGTSGSAVTTLVLLGSKRSSVLHPAPAATSFHWQANHRTNGAVGYTYHMRRDSENERGQCDEIFDPG